MFNRSPFYSSEHHDAPTEVSDLSSAFPNKVSGDVDSGPLPPSQPDSDVSRSRPRKRLRSDSSRSAARTPSRRKRLKPFYTKEYLQLYNRRIHRLTNQDNQVEDNKFEQSQCGLTLWSPSERELLFRALALRGRHDTRSIAAAVGSKSEPEVAAYLLLLEEASTIQQIHKPDESLLDLSDIPAAFEVSDECEKALEGAADALAYLQHNEDEKAERRENGDYWRLTPSIAKTIDKQLQQGPEGTAVIAETVPAGELLDLKSLLKLTERFYMNSSDPDYNYRTYANRYERISVYHTAFSDLQNLVISLTKRIIQTTLFTATSRLRAMESSSDPLVRKVKQADVIAALEILGMKADAHQYWVGLARRCNLKVYNTDSARDRRWRPVGARLDYGTVEAALNTAQSHKGHYARTPLEVSSRASTPLVEDADLSSSSDTASEYSASVAESEEASSPTALPLDHRSENDLKTQEYRDQVQDDYVSALDHQASLREEVRLWDILGRQPPQPIRPKDVDVPEKPVFEPKPLEEIENQRPHLSYTPRWETLGTSIPEEAFRQNRKGFSSKADARLSSG